MQPKRPHLCLSKHCLQRIGSTGRERLCLWRQGLWALRGPGEAEAMCAALNSAGHVDACTTNDGDALLFGAETLFHTLRIVVRLAMSCPRTCS